MSSPQAGSTWQAGANMFTSGTATWQPNAPHNDPNPTGVAVYIHAGGESGVVTNSGFAPITATTGNSQWNTTLQLIAANPPLGGGNGGNASYFIEAVLWGQGVPVVNVINGEEFPVFVMRQILVRNG